MPKDTYIPYLLQLFRQYGYDGATLSKISEATGLGKASLYHHFPSGKQEMAKAVLEYAGQWFAENILAPLRGEGTPAERIALMNDRLSQFYDCGRSACLLAIFTLGEPDSLFQEQVHQMLDAWINSLTVLLVETGIPSKEARQRAEDAVIQVQGALVLTRGLKSTKPFERVLQQLPVKLLEPMTMT
jgi:TetR/AcrR family transcriptional regulator, lmrAB and yxaGH operons repressor